MCARKEKSIRCVFLQLDDIKSKWMLLWPYKMLAFFFISDSKTKENKEINCFYEKLDSFTNLLDMNNGAYNLRLGCSVSV